MKSASANAADALGITQPAVSQQLKFAPELDDLHPEILLDAAAPVLRALASEHGYSRLAVFGSVARHQARPDSDIDLIIEAPAGTSSFGFLKFKRLIEQILGRQIDLVDYGGLKPRARRRYSPRGGPVVMERRASKELLHIRGWLRRIEDIVDRGEDAYIADDLLQEAGDSVMMKLGEASRMRGNVHSR